MYNVIVFHSHPKLKLSSLRFANPAIFIIPPPSYPKITQTTCIIPYSRKYWQI